MTALLELDAVEKRYGRAPVLTHIDFRLDPGEFVVLIGGSGSGKTTLLRLVGGLETADSGVIRLRSQVVDAPAGGVWVAPEKRRLGMVFQDYALWPHLSCLDNVMAAIPARTPDRRQQAMALLEKVGVGARAGQPPQRLSGGQQQRVGIARALAAKPDLLLFDEPLSSLDVDAREHLRLEIRSLTREYGAGALFVSHDPVDAWRLADRVVVLEQGRLIQAAAPEDLYAQPATARVARFIGAHGGFGARLIRQEGRLGVDLNGCFHPATPMGVGEGEDGIVFVRPAGVRPHSEGVAAELMHCAFEAGSYRAYWRIAGIGHPLCSLESTPPVSSTARLRIDPEHIFIYPTHPTTGANTHV
ncbi:ABC transporter ATP-binding protein [Mangrovitalea sediminis]|uniref:ABC transporter ATP-binding protein n=1 Tax=Mangrovitalea sediminis TaxID=1982043 RepID=UPI000BE4E40B|nr:ABC transporter ATP-binding protein [Mangrovitalea sediminis]